MIKSKSVLSVVATAAILGAVSISAQAVTSSFGFNTTGTVTYTPGPPANTVDTATSIDVTSPPAVTYPTNGAPTSFFTGLPAGTLIHLSGNTFQTGTGVDFTFSSPSFQGGDLFTFTSLPFTAQLGPLGTNNGSTATNAWSENGTLTDSAMLLGPVGAVGQLSLAAIQNLNPFSDNPNASWTFSSNTLPPPPPTVPEPGSVAMLVGLGLSSVGIMIRRRRI